MFCGGFFCFEWIREVVPGEKNPLLSCSPWCRQVACLLWRGGKAYPRVSGPSKMLIPNAGTHQPGCIKAAQINLPPFPSLGESGSLGGMLTAVSVTDSLFVSLKSQYSCYAEEKPPHALLVSRSFSAASRATANGASLLPRLGPEELGPEEQGGHGDLVLSPGSHSIPSLLGPGLFIHGQWPQDAPASFSYPCWMRDSACSLHLGFSREKNEENHEHKQAMVFLPLLYQHR